MLTCAVLHAVLCCAVLLLHAELCCFSCCSVLPLLQLDIHLDWSALLCAVSCSANAVLSSVVPDHFCLQRQAQTFNALQNQACIYAVCGMTPNESGVSSASGVCQSCTGALLIGCMLSCRQAVCAGHQSPKTTPGSFPQADWPFPSCQATLHPQHAPHCCWPLACCFLACIHTGAGQACAESPLAG